MQFVEGAVDLLDAHLVVAELLLQVFHNLGDVRMGGSLFILLYALLELFLYAAESVSYLGDLELELVADASELLLKLGETVMDHLYWAIVSVFLLLEGVSTLV